MISLSKFIYICTLIHFINPIFSQQPYDGTGCYSDAQIPGSNYLCNDQKTPCNTFLVFRAHQGYQTLGSIASLFNMNETQILKFNTFTEDYSKQLHLGQDVVIPINCSCLGQFSHAVYRYNASRTDALSDIACVVFGGLVKARTLVEENIGFGGNDFDSVEINVPLRCACPDVLSRESGVSFFTTYSVTWNDSANLIAKKFNVPTDRIRKFNKLDGYATIFAETTLLIPMEKSPLVNWDISIFSEVSSPSSKTLSPLNDMVRGTNSKLYMFVGFSLLAAFLVSGAICLIYLGIRRNKHQCFQPLSPKSTRLSDFSPDFLDGMLKLRHSLINFTFKELRIATDNFSEESKMGASVYKGEIKGSKFAFEKLRSDEAVHHVIDILTKINHINVVKPEGCCYDSNPYAYIVFEFAENGSLRNCLSNPKISKKLTWIKRLQIAFDLAVGLHYIHYCTSPAYVHRNINSNNVLITIDLRAKISGFRLAKPLMCKEEKEEIIWNESVIVGKEGYLAPEYHNYGLASLKTDVFAFGVVLLELLSGKEAIFDRILLKDCVKFLSSEGFDCEPECLDKMKKFIDPALEGDYPLGDAMCLSILAKACVDDDPKHRPTMNDVLKALSRIF